MIMVETSVGVVYINPLRIISIEKLSESLELTEYSRIIYLTAGRSYKISESELVVLLDNLDDFFFSW